jgi:hypothetical protein
VPCCAPAVFFTYTALSPTQGFFYMGIMVIGMTALYMTGEGGKRSEELQSFGNLHRNLEGGHIM